MNSLKPFQDLCEAFQKGITLSVQLEKTLLLYFIIFKGVIGISFNVIKVVNYHLKINFEITKALTGIYCMDQNYEFMNK